MGKSERGEGRVLIFFCVICIGVDLCRGVISASDSPFFRFCEELAGKAEFSELKLNWNSAKPRGFFCVTERRCKERAGVNWCTEVVLK